MNPLSHAEHLALYSAFHRGHGNRLLHIAGQAGVLFGGSMVAVHFYWPLVPAILLIHIVTWARLSLFGGAVAGLVSFALAALAWLTSTVVPGVPLVAAGLALHFGSWWLLVKVGHQHLEPRLQTPEGEQDSNLYFRQQLYLCRNVGFAASALDAWTQFTIAPLSSAWDLLELLGVRNPEGAEVAALREGVLRRLARGQAPFAARASQSAVHAGVKA